MPETWNTHKGGDAEAEVLSDAIELSLSEYSGGYLSLTDLKSNLKELALIAIPFASGEEDLLVVVARSGSISVPDKVRLQWGPIIFESPRQVLPMSVSISAMRELQRISHEAQLD